MDPSAKVSSRTPGAISLPGMGSAFAPGAGGVEMAIGTCDVGLDGAAAGAGDKIFADSGAGCAFAGAAGVGFAATATFCGGLSAEGAGSSTVEGADEGGGTAAGAGSATATLAGFTSASRRFLASAAKFPLGYLSR